MYALTGYFPLDLWQQINKFRELYLREQEEKLNLKAELKECQVMLTKLFINHA